MNSKTINLTKIFYLLSAVVFLSGCGESTNEEASKQVMMTGVELKNMAIASCRTKLNKAVGREMYVPTETIGGGTTSLILRWKGEKDDFKIADCSYSMDHGLTSLVIDDKIVFEKKI